MPQSMFDNKRKEQCQTSYDEESGNTNMVFGVKSVIVKPDIDYDIFILSVSNGTDSIN